MIWQTNWRFLSILIHSWTAKIPVSPLHFKLKHFTLLSSFLEVKFSDEFCSNIQPISTILVEVWSKTNSSTPIFSVLGDFMEMVKVFKNDGLDFGSLWIVGTGCNCHNTGVGIFYHVL